MARRYFGLTGTPGTGKKTLAPRIAEKLGLPCVSLTAEACEARVASAEGDEVDTEALAERIVGRISRPALVYGHLLPYVIRRSDLGFLVVLRCEPRILKRRLESRGYARGKVRENVEAELIGILCADSVRAYGAGRVAEFDTTSASFDSADSTASTIASQMRTGRARGEAFDWLPSYATARRLRELLS